LSAKGQLSELKTVLGWTINTHQLTISLPDHKMTDWSRDITSILSSKKADFKILEPLMGRLSHIACIFLPMRHCMGPKLGQAGHLYLQMNY
jgi:hypothetical protein